MGPPVNGGAGGGVIFKITPQGKYATLHTFCEQPNCLDGAFPVAGLIQGPNGDLYGTTIEGGVSNTGCPSFNETCGTVFRITQGGIFTTLYKFCSQASCADGAIPLGNLILGTDGNFYGTASRGGAGCPYGCGTVFKLSPEGRLTTLHSFVGSDGSEPTSALVQGSDGNFYGTTFQGGEGGGNAGAVFRVSADGTFTTLYSFCVESCLGGMNPRGGLIQATDGNLYGLAFWGGAYGYGSLYEITLDGMLTTIYSFCDPFDNCSVGNSPAGVTLQSTNGLFYGTTTAGGTQAGGTVFEFNNGLGPFVAFVLPQGRVGQPAHVLGQGFTGTTNVSFSGIPASFTVVFDTFLEATVPTGATTGYVTVTTLSGTLTSNVKFNVLP